MSPAAPPRIGDRERTLLLAMSMAVVALGIDLLLPAFADVRADLGLPADSTAVAGLITAYFIGMALGQPLYGPLSDQWGRKPLLYASYVVYAVGALLSAVAPTLPLLLVSRFIWGLGGAGPRVLTIAIVRDRYEGENMSRAMSLIMSIFILVPVVAPTVGAIGVSLGSWRWLAVGCTVAALAMMLWTTRLAESLAPEHRRQASVTAVGQAARMVLSNPQTVLMMTAMTFLYGSFTSYLASSELIISEVFDQAGAFPVIFGGVALFMGGAMLVNARVVRQVGARRLAGRAMAAYVVASAAMVVISFATDGLPPLWVFLLPLAVALGGHAILIPNLNALAMAPMGNVAGMASAIIGALQIAVGAMLGAVLDRLFDGTVMPLSLGFLGIGLVATALFSWAGRQIKVQPVVVDAQTSGELTLTAQSNAIG
ncbi:MAG: multidrug effflux MFS transporter [Euzebya sp.]